MFKRPLIFESCLTTITQSSIVTMENLPADDNAWSQQSSFPIIFEHNSFSSRSETQHSQSSSSWPAATPQLAAQALAAQAFATEALAAQAPPATPAPSGALPRSRSKPKNLTEEERLIILRLAIQAKEAYGHGRNTTFWKNISKDFERDTGKKHATLSRTVTSMVKARLKALAEDPSREEARETSYTNAIDEWISVVEEQEAIEKERKDAQGTRDAESQFALEWREQMFHRLGEKDGAARLAQGRKRHRAASRANENDEEAQDGGSDEEDDAFELTPITHINTPLPERKRRRSTKVPSSYDDDELPRHVGWLVDIFAARLEQSADNSGVVEELKTEVSGLKDKLDKVETGVADILSLLKRQAEFRL